MTREINGVEASVLTSWKEIASYLGKGVRTVQRWERQLGLPVRRPMNSVQKRIVLARRADLDAWIAQHWSDAGANSPGSDDGREELRHRMILYEQLHSANQLLYQEFRDAFNRLRLQLEQSAGLVQGSSFQPSMDQHRRKLSA